MIDWNPLIAAAAVFVTALGAAVPQSVVVILQHRGTRDAISANSATLANIERSTNGALSDANAAIRSLRAEVVRLTAVVDASRPSSPPGGGDHHG